MKTTSNPLAYAQMTAAMILVGSLFVASKSDFTAVPWFVWLLVLYTGIGVTALGRVNDNLKTHVCVFKVTMPKSIRDDFT